MNYMTLPLLGITVNGTSCRKTSILFMNELIKRLPFVCDRIFSYMEQDRRAEIENNKSQLDVRIVLKDKNQFINSEGHYTWRLAQLDNGWHFNAPNHPIDYLRLPLDRLEGALGDMPIMAVMDTTAKGAQDVAIKGHIYRNLTPEQVEHILK